MSRGTLERANSRWDNACEGDHADQVHVCNICADVLLDLCRRAGRVSPINLVLAGRPIYEGRDDRSKAGA